MAAPGPHRSPLCLTPPRLESRVPRPRLPTRSCTASRGRLIASAGRPGKRASRESVPVRRAVQRECPPKRCAPYPATGVSIPRDSRLTAVPNRVLTLAVVLWYPMSVVSCQTRSRFVRGVAQPLAEIGLRASLRCALFPPCQNLINLPGGGPLAPGSVSHCGGDGAPGGGRAGRLFILYKICVFFAGFLLFAFFFCVQPPPCSPHAVAGVVFPFSWCLSGRISCGVVL
ncbi:UNVERIFIED_CONTAM: hypothetical protein Sangu_1651800 [Sesamum angustifolium]|uniref:Uncharacterized protein n=1 Tax=Sesamum angustifolium TaxID=2727405 RepID=A0AAW2MJL8_9LAMI